MDMTVYEAWTCLLHPKELKTENLSVGWRETLALGSSKGIFRGTASLLSIPKTEKVKLRISEMKMHYEMYSQTF